MTGVFASEAPRWRARDYWPRPILPATKACKIHSWQLPDIDIPREILSSWLAKYADHGIGLLMGSPFPDGTRLGAIDIDSDDYVRLGQSVLREPPCGRIGSKGAVYFVRVAGDLGNPKFKLASDRPGLRQLIAECLFARTLCVIPPTIHPTTGQPYRWVGEPLDQIDFRRLPLVEG